MNEKVDLDVIKDTLFIIVAISFVIGAIFGMIINLSFFPTGYTTLFVVFGDGSMAKIEVKDYDTAESFCNDLNGMLYPNVCNGSILTCKIK